MTEKEKMLKGEFYKSFGEELFNERQRSKELVFKLNSISPLDVDKRNEIISELLGNVGINVFIEPPFRCDYGYNIEIGDNFYSNYNCIILDCAKVKIGANVMFGPNVGIYTAGHPLDLEERNEGYEYAKPINIGSNVWIGGNTVINPGVTIGENSVIGSGSVVTKDIPADSLAVGNPCKVLRKITEKDKKVRPV